jgi:transcription elongation factor GreA
MRTQTRFAPSVGIGSTVYLRDLASHEQETYTLTGPGDADIRQNCISTMTPIGRALYGRRPGEVVEFEAPGGTIAVEIVAVEPSPQLQLARDG